MKNYYDKLLHVAGTFTAMAFLTLFIPCGFAIGIVLVLQLGKTWWNFKDWTYCWLGDWLANIIGYALFAAFWALSRYL